MKFESLAQNTCPECNAPLIDEFSCWDTLGLLLSWESDDTELQKVHFLTVATYNIQHPSLFQEEAIKELRKLHRKYIDNEITINEIRIIVGKLAKGDKRVLKSITERVIIPQKWKMTIADVYIPDMKEEAPDRVRRWAKSIHHDLIY